MINYYYSRGTGGPRKLPFGNPIANALVVIVGALAIAASVVLGFIALIAIGSLVMVLAAILGIRLWWLGRKLGRQPGGDDRRHGSTASGEQRQTHIIEGEYSELAGPRRSTKS